MKIGNFKFLFIYSLIVYFACSNIYAEDKIETLPLINLEELSPTFEEDKTELEKIDDKNISTSENENISYGDETTTSDKVYINLITKS